MTLDHLGSLLVFIRAPRMKLECKSCDSERKDVGIFISLGKKLSKSNDKRLLTGAPWAQAPAQEHPAQVCTRYAGSLGEHNCVLELAEKHKQTMNNIDHSRLIHSSLQMIISR